MRAWPGRVRFRFAENVTGSQTKTSSWLASESPQIVFPGTSVVITQQRHHPVATDPKPDRRLPGNEEYTGETLDLPATSGGSLRLVVFEAALEHRSSSPRFGWPEVIDTASARRSNAR